MTAGTIRKQQGWLFALGAFAALLAALAAGRAWQGAVEAAPTSGDAPSAAQIESAPLAFESLAGDRYLARSVAGGTLLLDRSGATVSLGQGGHELRLATAGGRLGAPAAIAQLPGKVNSFIGDDPARWRSGVPTYGRVRYADVYPGIDLDFHGDQTELEYDFRIAAGADPGRIAVELAGADRTRLTPGGDLLIDVGPRTIRQPAPVAYQDAAGERRPVRSAFALDGDRLTFDVGRYDHRRALMIDPLVLAYSTRLGSPASDLANAVAVGPDGAAYIAGEADAAGFPSVDPAQTNFGGARDATVTKFEPDDGGPAEIAYSTYLGGTDLDTAYGIAVDDAGAAYVTGETNSTAFPTQDQLATIGGDQPQRDGFVAKLSPDTGGAVTLAYSTYLGAEGAEDSDAIAVGPDGAAYVTGSTSSTTFPIQDELPLIGTNPNSTFDVFITKFNPDAGGPVTLAYSTYIGSNDADGGAGIAVDADGAAYVAGLAGGTDFPIMSFAQTNQPGRDGFVLKLQPGGAADLDWSTYLGGDSSDEVTGLAVTPEGSAWVGGLTDSTDFPTAGQLQADQPARDGFVTAFAPGGTAVRTVSTYLGGDSFDEASAIDVGPAGNVLVTGTTASANFPLVEPTQANRSGATDAFVSEFTPASAPLALRFSTLLGGASNEQGFGVAAGPGDAIFVAGTTSSGDFPSVDPSPGVSTGMEQFLTRLAPAPPETPVTPDTQAPETTILKKPKRRTTKPKAKFRFTSNEPGSTFECKLDKRAFKPCAARSKFKVKVRRHKLRVRAIDAAGNADQTPAKAKWKVKAD